MANRIATRLETILPVVKTQLVNVITPGQMDPTQIFSSLVDDKDLMQRAPNARFLAIKPLTFPIWENAVTGGGNDVLWIDGEWEITYFVRYAADVDFADDKFLLDATSGILTLWSGVITALQQFDPTDQSGNLLLAEPMRLASLGWRNMPTSHGKVGSWGRLKSWWEVKYTHVV